MIAVETMETCRDVSQLQEVLIAQDSHCLTVKQKYLHLRRWASRWIVTSRNHLGKVTGYCRYHVHRSFALSAAQSWVRRVKALAHSASSGGDVERLSCVQSIHVSRSRILDCGTLYCSIASGLGSLALMQVTAAHGESSRASPLM